jgi:hypothetical protein
MIVPPSRRSYLAGNPQDSQQERVSAQQEEHKMKSTPRRITLAAITTLALLPAGAAARPIGAAGPQLHGDQSQSPGAYICGINYSMNSVDGKYCPPRHAIESQPPASAAPAKVIVRDSGFAWGDAAAGAGAALVIVLLGAGTATATSRRNRTPRRVRTTG